MANETLFRCASCGQEKPVSEFQREPRLTRGYTPNCRECIALQSRRKRERTKESKCTVSGCDKGQMAKGLCSMHYMRLRTTGSVGSASPKNRRLGPRCTVEGCNQRPIAKGFCKLHYIRVLRSGDAGSVERTDKNYRRDGQYCIEPGCQLYAYCQRRCEKHYRQWTYAHRPICKAEGCMARALTLRDGYCPNHRAKFRKYGDPFGGAPNRTGEIVRCAVDDCEGNVIAKGFCEKHYHRQHQGRPLDGMTKWRRRSLELKEKGKLDEAGYRLVWAPDHVEARSTGYVLEHRKVVSDDLGRPLRRNENIHHVNGQRGDNRRSNLSLWVSSQPSGQRAEDLVDWAVELLGTYLWEFPTDKSAALRSLRGIESVFPKAIKQ